MKQQSLFPNPPDLKADVSKPDLLKDFISAKKPLVLKPVKRSRLDQIYLPENKGLIQTQIPLGRQFDYPDWVFPPIYRTEDKVKEIIKKSYETGRLGLDFEFDPKNNRISIIGVATTDICAASHYTPDLGRLLIDFTRCGGVLVGHFVLGADKEVLEKDFNIKTPLDSWEDSMIWHYLLRACLTKKPGKEENEGAAGFMGLGFAAHLWTYLPNYKDCRGIGCFGPCPKHDVFAYCAVDSWAGLMVADKAQEESEVKNIPPRVYEEHAVLACNFCIAAEKRGFDLDHEYIKKLSSEMEEEKEKIFHNNQPFNPRSDKQVKGYFKSRGIDLKDTQRETVEKELEKVILSYGIEDMEAWNKLSEDAKPDLAEGAEQELAKLYLYKSLGKGLKAWFDEKFIHSDGKIHPRVIFTGASTMRLSMSRPNCQNWPKTGWGKKIKRCILPPPGYKWLACDSKNLEYRVALWLSGMDVNTIGWDAFQYILNNAGNIFDKPAAIIGQTPRQVAKTTSYLTLYFGGFRLLDEWELKTARIKRDIAKGILVVFPDWKYFDKIVAFTGIRLADKLFRNHKDESRKAALELQELYFDKLPLRNFHKLATKTAEKGFCQTPWGSYLELIEGLHDDPKVCSSKLGQGIGAEYVQGKQVWYLKNGSRDAIMQLQVHDDITFCVPKSWSDEQCLDFARPLFAPSHRYPELSIPWEVAVGENNLGEMRVLNHGFI